MSALASLTCSACGRPIASARLRGLCGPCLVRGVTAGDGEKPPEESGGPLFRIPGHDVLDEIARGSMIRRGRWR